MPKSTLPDGKVKPPPAAAAPASAGAAGGHSLPCLYSNNVTETAPGACQELETTLGLCNLLSPYHKRQAHTLFSNVHRLVTKVAPTPGHVGFLTITTPDVIDNDELRERWRSFTTHFLKPHPDFGEWINTKEVQKRGSWHFHLVIVLSQDIREGVDFDQISKGNYSSASPYLRRIWKELREALPLYGFGRSELLPVKSNADGIARYVGKYISKHIGSRAEEHKGVRLISYSTGWERNSIRFAWNTKNASEWRRKLAIFAKHHGCQEFYQLSAKLGQGWAYRYAQEIMDADSLESERMFNLLQGIAEKCPVYVDRNVREHPHKRARNGQQEIRKIAQFSRSHKGIKWEYAIERIRKAEARKQERKNEAQRDLMVAKSGIKEWLSSIGDDVERISGAPGHIEIIDGVMLVRSGERQGEMVSF